MEPMEKWIELTTKQIGSMLNLHFFFKSKFMSEAFINILKNKNRPIKQYRVY